MMTREMICRGCPGKLNGDCYGCRENPDSDSDDDRDVEEEEEEIADIVREMRGMPKDYIVDANANFVFRRYADRIEAAHKREIERLRGALLTICTAHGNLRDIAIAACNGQDCEAVARAVKEKEANDANA